MEPLFLSIVMDVIIVGVCGLLGGFGLGLLHENGIELPRRRRKVEEDSTVTGYLDFGFLADMFIGGLAAVVVYALNPPANSTQLLGTSLVSGLGGAGILKGYIEARRNQALSYIADQALDLADTTTPGSSSSRSGAPASPPVAGMSVPSPSAPAAPVGMPPAARDERIRTLRSQLREISK